jgi:organic hydroperoxide reductase OsmC/OhrA
MARRHTYRAEVVWTGDQGTGTSGYRAYGRGHELRGAGKAAILGSSDPLFRGDASRWNPEELLVASVSACHQLWYLHLCAAAGVVVTGYEDHAEGVMLEEDDGAGQFERVTLRPRVTIAAASDAGAAERLHAEAHAKCFIARSVNFEVACEPTIVRAAEAAELT